MTITSHNKIVTLGLLIVGLIVVNMLIGVRGEFSLRPPTIFTHKLTATEIGLLRLAKPCPGAVPLMRRSDMPFRDNNAST